MATTEQLESSFAPAVLKHLQAKYEAQPKKGKWETFLKDLTDPKATEALPVKVNLSDPISQYFVSSSHNTYLTGNQLWSKASTDPYKDVLKRGCRCIEVDVWDGGSPSATSSSSSSDNEGAAKEPPKKAASNAGDADVNKLAGAIKKGLGRIRSASSAGSTKATEAEASAPPSSEDKMPTPWRTNSREEPRVLHGYTATKEISFRAVCEVVRDYAFVATDLPLIVSLEVHCSHEQQEVMVECMNDYWKGYLVDMPKNFSDDTPLPPLSSLKKKILVKVKYTPPEKKHSKFSRSNAKGASEKDEDEEDQVDQSKKGKIIEALSKLGVYVRSCHFDSLDQPEAKIPTHIFALSESKVISLLEQNRTALFTHNLNHLMRAYPKGTRVRSTNLDPGPFWRQGIQIVALNWQQMNAAMMMNEAMFTGSGGWINKPEGYRPGPKGGDPPPIKRIGVDLRMKLLAAQKLDQEKSSSPNCYVKAEIHVESSTEKEAGSIPDGGKNKGGEWKRKSAVRHSKDPDFGGDTLEFKGVEDLIPELSFIR